MEKDFMFVKTDVKKNKVNIRRTIIGRSMAGIFFQNNIRFYYDSIYEKIKDRNMRRMFRAWSEDFEIVNNSVNIKVKNCDLIKKYNFKDEVFVLYSEGYFDIIPFENLSGYLNDFCYSKDEEEKIKRNKLLLLKRNVDNTDDINIQLKGLDN